MSTLSERLLAHKAACASEMIVDGGLTPEQFSAAWTTRLEPLYLAQLHREPPEPVADARPIAHMSASEKTELRTRIGNHEFAARVARENVK